jgi:hypothetical protein
MHIYSPEQFIAYLYIMMCGLFITSHFFVRMLNDPYTVRKRLEDLEEESSIDDQHYQAWIGTYEEDDTTLSITILRKDLMSVRDNAIWSQWDRTSDASVYSRNQYLLGTGLEWGFYSDSLLEKNGAVFEGTYPDWRGMIDISGSLMLPAKGTFCMSDARSKFKRLIENNSIEWSRCLVSLSDKV